MAVVKDNPDSAASATEKRIAFDTIRQEVEANQDIIILSMERLRNAIGARKLGTWVRKDIDKELRGRGLVYYPQELPVYQHELVKVYKQGSRVETIINAILSDAEESVDVLREAAGNEDSVILEQVRRLVCP